MPNPPGNSRQRKQHNKIVEEVVKRLGRQPVSSHQQSEQPGQLADKLLSLWESTALWSAISLVAGVIFSQLSRTLAFVFAWAVMWLAIFKAGIFDKSRSFTKVFGNLAAGVAVAGILLFLWRILPQPKQPPTLDQEVDALIKKVPWLNKEPKTIVQASQQRTHTVVRFIPMAEANPPSLALNAGEPIRLGVEYENAGNASVRNASCRGRFYVRRISINEEKQMKEDLEQHGDFLPMGVFLAAKGDKHFCKVEQKILSESELHDLHSTCDKETQKTVGCYRLFVMASVKWEDESGLYETQMCKYVGQNDEMPGIFTWNSCTVHNDEVRLR